MKFFLFLKSCGIHEHQYPVYFSRFIRGELPYSSKGINYQRNFLSQLKYYLEKNFNVSDVKDLIQKQKKFPNKPYPNSVLIAPSVGPLSFLSNTPFIEALIQVKSLLFVI